MITGTVISSAIVYYSDGRQALQTRAGDRVEADIINSSNKWIVSKLIRNGRSMLLAGLYFLDGSAILSDAPPPDPDPIPPSDKPILGRVWLNYEKMEKDHNPKKPVPDTRSYILENVGDNGRVTWTKRHQEFFFNEMKSYVPDWNQTKDKKEEFKHDFIYALDDELAMFNGAGSETRRIYPYNLHMNQRLEPWQNFVLFGGTLLELASRTPERIRKNEPFKRYPFYGINAMAADLEKYTSRAFPRRWTRLSISFGARVPKSEPGSYFHGWCRYPMFMNNTDIGWIDERFVKVLADGEIPAPQFTFDWAG